MSSRLWGILEIPEKIEFISYNDQYREKTLSVGFKGFSYFGPCNNLNNFFNFLFVQVIRNSFFKYEIGCVTCEIDSSLEAKKDLESLCEEVLRSSGVSIIARDVTNDNIVGVALNMIQVRTNHDFLK